MQVVPPIVCIATLPFGTTSPIFLVKKGQMEQAKQSIRKLYGAAADIPARLAIIQQAVAIEREEAAKIGASTYKDLFATAVARKRTFATAWLWFTYQANGQVFIASGLYFLIITGKPSRLREVRDYLRGVVRYGHQHRLYDQCLLLVSECACQHCFGYRHQQNRTTTGIPVRKVSPRWSFFRASGLTTSTA